MSMDFEELDYQHSFIGDISLRKRREPRLHNELVYEVKLGDEFLMSSLVTVGEIALADLAIADFNRASLDVVVGGLGLGYTARAALAYSNVDSMLIIEALAPVIDWHRRGLVPLGNEIIPDPRCRVLAGDFFALASSAEGFDPAEPGRKFNAILLDIDHSPRHHLSDGNASFYRREGLQQLYPHLQPGAVFAVWSNDPPEPGFITELDAVFATARAEVVKFPNPYTGSIISHTIYLANVSE